MPTPKKISSLNKALDRADRVGLDEIKAIMRDQTLQHSSEEIERLCKSPDCIFTPALEEACQQNKNLASRLLSGTMEIYSDLCNTPYKASSKKLLVKARQRFYKILETLQSHRHDFTEYVYSNGYTFMHFAISKLDEKALAYLLKRFYKGRIGNEKLNRLFIPKNLPLLPEDAYPFERHAEFAGATVVHIAAATGRFEILSL